MKTLGKISGAIGLLLVGTSWMTLLASPGFTVFFIAIGLGLGLVGFWAVSNRGQLASWARTTFFYSSSVILFVGLLVLLVAANFIVARRNQTWDLTSKKIYSLSPQTISTLKELKEPVRAINFLPGAPPEQVESLFKRYQTETDKFSYEFRDPRKDPQGAAEFQIREGQPATVLVKGVGKAQSHTMVNLAKVASAALGEQELTNGIIKLNGVGSQKLYFTQGHGEWPLEPEGQSEEAMAGSLALLKRVCAEEGYEPSALSMVEKGEIPADASAIVIAGAHSAFLEREVKLVADFVDRGGRLLYFAEQGTATGLEPLLEKYGVQIDKGLVADTRGEPENPYLVIAPFYGEHEIVNQLKQQKQPAVFATTRGLTVLKEGLLPSVVTTPLVLTSPYAWEELTPSENPTISDGEKSGQLVLGVAITRDTKGSANKRFDEARLIVFGDSDCLAGGFAFDRNLVMNSIAWATQQLTKITIRPPDRDLSTIDINTERFSNIRLLSIYVLPILLLSIGLTIWQLRRAR